MRNPVLLKIQEKNPRRPLFTGMALIVLFVSFMAGCGGLNSANTPVATTFTFNSSNTKIATISPQGNVCAGVWDSSFVVCNGSDAQGNPITGTATITATAAGV